MGPNIMLVQGTTHSYYTPSQSRSQNSRQPTLFTQEYVDRALAVERAHGDHLEAHLTHIESLITMGSIYKKFIF